jgi:hypothetical protein
MSGWDGLWIGAGLYFGLSQLAEAIEALSVRLSRVNVELRRTTGAEEGAP